jgi:hypothetical protein
MSISQYLNMIASNGTPIWCLPWPKIQTRIQMTSDVEVVTTVPSGGYNCAIFQFSAGAATWVALNQTATEPPDLAFQTGSAIMINPICVQVQGGDVLHLISPSPDHVNIMYYVSE